MKPYQPKELALKDIAWDQLIDLMGKANRYIARYDGLLQSVINLDILLAPLRTQEAVPSSKIEGTHSQFAIQCLDSLFIQPIFSSRNFERNSSIPRSSVARLLSTLVENDIIKIVQQGAGRRPKIYTFRRLLNIVIQ